MEREALLGQGVAVYQVGEVYENDTDGALIPENEKAKWFVSVPADSPLIESVLAIPLADTESEAWGLAADHCGRGEEIMKAAPMNDIPTDDADVLGIVGQLDMLLRAVARAAVDGANPDARAILATDGPAQAHFHELSRLLRGVSGHDPALIEYARTSDDTARLMVMDGDHNHAGWPVWRRVV